MQSDNSKLFQWTKADDASLVVFRDLCVETFRQTYAHLNTPSNFKNYVERAFNIDRLREEVLNPESFFFVLPNEDDQLIAYIKLNTGKAQTEDKPDSWVELERIYVDRKHRGKGLGKLLIIHAEEFTRAKGKKGIWLGVWEQNESAIAFYRQMNYAQAGTHIFQFGNDAQTDFIMQKII